MSSVTKCALCVHYVCLATIRIEGARTVLESVGTTEVCVTLMSASPGDAADFNVRTVTSLATRKWQV